MPLLPAWWRLCPQPEAHATFLASRDDTVTSAFTAATASLSSALTTVLDLSEAVMARVPEVNSKLQKASLKRQRDGDSGVDDDGAASTALWQRLDSQWHAFEGYRDSTISMWSRKMQVRVAVQSPGVLQCVYDRAPMCGGYVVLWW